MFNFVKLTNSNIKNTKWYYLFPKNYSIEKQTCKKKKNNCFLNYFNIYLNNKFYNVYINSIFFTQKNEIFSKYENNFLLSNNIKFKNRKNIINYYRELSHYSFKRNSKNPLSIKYSKIFQPQVFTRNLNEIYFFKYIDRDINIVNGVNIDYNVSNIKRFFVNNGTVSDTRYFNTTVFSEFLKKNYNKLFEYLLIKNQNKIYQNRKNFPSSANSKINLILNRFLLKLIFNIRQHKLKLSSETPY